jgi:RimJ/RimL family protein N-acetyltransferase
MEAVSTAGSEQPSGWMLRGTKVILRPKRLPDAEDDLAWRTDDELAQLDAAPPLRMTLREYLAVYGDEYRGITPEQALALGQRRIRLAIDALDGHHIGNITLYDIDRYRRQAELGIMIGEKAYWSQGYGSDAIRTLLAWVCTHTDLDRIYLHTLEWNIRAQRSFQKVGFRETRRTREGRYQFVEMEIRRPDFCPPSTRPNPPTARA